MSVEVERFPTWNEAWGLGDALWWRDEQGVHSMVQIELPTFGPRGGRRTPGTLATIFAPTLAGINEKLNELGFDPVDLTEDEIAWTGR